MRCLTLAIILHIPLHGPFYHYEVEDARQECRPSFSLLPFSCSFVVDNTFAGDKTRVSLISWRVTQRRGRKEEEGRSRDDIPDKSGWRIVDSQGRSKSERGEPVWTSCFQEGQGWASM